MLKHIPFYATLLGRQIDQKTKATNRHVLVYGAIEVHSTGRLGCIASNSTIAEETGLNVVIVSRTISDLRKAGWVTFDLDEKFNRSPITPLLDISTPYIKNTPPTKNVPPPTLNVTPPPHKKGHIDNIIGNNKETVKATTSPVEIKATKVKPKVEKNKVILEDPTINNVIEYFKVVDENYTRVYANLTERKAVKTLLSLHTPQAIHDMLAKAVMYNKLPYISGGDKVYTPSELLRNWSRIKDKEAEYIIKPKVEQKEASDKASARVVW